MVRPLSNYYQERCVRDYALRSPYEGHGLHGMPFYRYSTVDISDYASQGGMMSTWNKFCFTGGAFLASVTLPGSPSVAGLWPAVWAMGNLGRAGYGASLDGMWPVRLSVVFSLLVSLTWTRCSVHIRLLRRRHSAKSNNTGRSAHRRYYQRRRSRGRRSILSSGAETLALHLPWGRAP